MSDSQVRSCHEERDYDWIRQTLTNLLLTMLDKLRDVEVPTRSRSFWQEDDGHFASYVLPLPSYRHIRDRIWEAACDSPTTELLDYLWRHRNAIWGHASAAAQEDRDTWDRNKIRWWLEIPLLAALEQSTIEQLVDLGQVEVWHVDRSIIDQIVEREIAHLQALARGCSIHTASFLVGEILKPEAVPIELGYGLRLLPLRGRDKALFWSRWDSQIPYEFVELGCSHVLDCSIIYDVTRFPTFDGKLAFLQESAVRQMNLVKWALMLATGEKWPLTEGVGIITNTMGNYVTRIRRETLTQRGSRPGPRYEMDEREIGVGRELIDGFMRLAASAADIWDVLWYFGRASVAPTARDAFLEAVIGLDSLLTTSGPNATYKFRLHGASLLAADSKQGEALYKELKKIYDKRSGVAHGRSDTIGQEDPDRVLHLLAQTIDATVCLHQEGILPVSGNEGLNKSIERLVRQRATAAASESLSLRPHCHSAEN